ncbi:AraC-like ligand binding domain-containing protein [Catalinimonas alkaloidigena]|uniref:AraC-like ligand binding domain-containing protein n=2 Tax=Catalinimonas alkaloidigena TaxID=1075417 RepID=A0A1G9P456_9BACT|nr:AraC-like ligand binding domain-containing protein [Catalinimonas alkaloidigena]
MQKQPAFLYIPLPGKRFCILISRQLPETKRSQAMKIEKTVQPFEMEEETLLKWTKRPHQHNFFELVFIKEGTGSQCINDMLLPYQKDSLFLLPPYDCHSFQIQTPTTFVFIRFNALFFQEDKRQMMDYREWFKNLHYILSTYNRVPGDIMHAPSDKALIISLITNMLHERQQARPSESILRTNMVAMLNILVRNFENRFLESHHADAPEAKDLLQYIQHNLFENDKLKAEAIAETFHLAPSYVSEYFKKKVGSNLKEYILKARVNVAQSRIQHSGQSLKEIAYELGFTDASHLTKVIKKYYDEKGTVCNSWNARA